MSPILPSHLPSANPREPHDAATTSRIASHCQRPSDPYAPQGLHRRPHPFVCGWQFAGGRWQMAKGRSPVADTDWQVANDQWRRIQALLRQLCGYVKSHSSSVESAAQGSCTSVSLYTLSSIPAPAFSSAFPRFTHRPHSRIGQGVRGGDGQVIGATLL